ncbi:MAG TPA: Stp1/IreP family PP2C-type Ser/Thr phosphatase [Verrucomicrobiae bacterium]|nr:Stp1/IreP family PP2C-type Ser/Thr phosphatase [Verrucomicrobiae bacterium]
MRTDAITDVGLVRKENEDSFLIREDLGLAVVADGMGGHEAGEVASLLAVKTLEDSLQENPGFDEVSLGLAVKAANSAIYRQASENPSFQGMGTTLTALWWRGSKALIGHVGDSRAYLIRNQQISLLTTDHSLVNELVQGGHITEAEALTHPQRNVVTRALGVDVNVEVDLIAVEVEQGDKFVLCSDGFSNLINAEEILAALATEPTGPALSKLKQMALDRGGFDNITAVLVEF